MTSLSAADMRALEQTRQRLYQLTNSLASLQHNIQHSDPLPPWTSLQSLATIISQNLQSITQHLSANDALLSTTTVYPLPDLFPARTQEGLLGQLLRKKLEPNVEEWVERGRRTAAEASARWVAAAGEEGRGFDRVALHELWAWAGPAANEEARRRRWGDDFSLEEREAGIEKVVTGLRRTWEREEGEDDDEEEEEDESDESGGDEGDGKATKGGGVVDESTKEAGMSKAEAGLTTTTATATATATAATATVIPPLKMDDWLRFMSTGAEPRGIAPL
ncbi:MAG: mediator of RNA polymerase II transcription subunit 8 [Phylliscum demangeonii]|nr:MAG: mediator of RNA polymerase II transcription subunit 8 [Phylliscum demangeonii]